VTVNDDLTVDLFAGPCGWGEGLRRLGYSGPVEGIEIDTDACKTAISAGHSRLQADVRDARRLFPKGQVRRLIASPPCQGFSTAGKGKGRADSVRLLEELEHVTDLASLEHAMLVLDIDMSDPRTLLVLEPLWWALHHAPDWVALEQVPAVQPIWDAYALILAEHGYSVDTAILNAEQYGVPQTRRRSILVAHRHRAVSLPTPTHSRYYPRNPTQLDEGVPRWVSMADALGWNDDDLVGFPRRADRDDIVTIDGVDYRARDLRRAHLPAQAVTEKSRSWSHFAGAGATAQDTGGQRQRPVDEPAHTITGKGTAAWIYKGGTGANATKRAASQPAPTVHFGARLNSVDWLTEVPTVTRRVTIDEAAQLQSFPADYPWSGSRTSQYQQVGNAIPPMLAEAVLGQLVGRPA
jgi:DNA (cytosine-5)-methyltransferase 1